MVSASGIQDLSAAVTESIPSTRISDRRWIAQTPFAGSAELRNCLAAPASAECGPVTHPLAATGGAGRCRSVVSMFLQQGDVD